MATLSRLAVEKIPLEQLPELLERPLPPEIVTAIENRFTIDALWKEGLLENPTFLDIALDRIGPKIFMPYLEGILIGYSLTERMRRSLALFELGRDIKNFLNSPGAKLTPGPVMWDYYSGVYRFYDDLSSPRVFSSAEALIMGVFEYNRTMDKYTKLKLSPQEPDSLEPDTLLALRAIGAAVEATPGDLWRQLLEGTIVLDTPFELGIRQFAGDYAKIRVIGDYLHIEYTIEEEGDFEFDYYNRRNGLAILNSLFLSNNSWSYEGDSVQ